MIERFARDAGIGMQAAGVAVGGGTVFASIAETLMYGEDVLLPVSGGFARANRPARDDRNPRTDARGTTSPLAGSAPTAPGGGRFAGQGTSPGLGWPARRQERLEEGKACRTVVGENDRAEICLRERR